MSSTLNNSPSANDIQACLRLKRVNTEIGPLTLADGAQGPVVETLVRSIVQKSHSFANVLLTTGLGLSREDSVPVRIPAILIPGLQVMEQCKKRGLEMPHYLIYQASDFIAANNNIPEDQAQRVSDQICAYVQEYIQKLHPDLVSSVHVINQKRYKEVQTTIENLANEMRAGIEKTEALQGIGKKLKEYEARHSNATGSALSYAAANAVYHGATQEYPYADILRAPPAAVFPIGGLAEKPFFALTVATASGAFGQVSQTPIIPMLTKLGSRPAYYAYPEHGDPTDAVNLAEKITKLRDGPLRADFAALQVDGADPLVLSDIFSHNL